MPKSRSHAPFAIWNRTINPVVRFLLRTPLRQLAGRQTALITVTGKKSGRRYTFPVWYSQRGDSVRVGVGWPERKRWWRNLLGEGGPVEMMIRGQRRTGHGVAKGDEATGVMVHIQLDPVG